MYKRKNEGWMKHLDFILLDLICIQIAFISAYFMRYGFVNPYIDSVYRNMALFFFLADIVIIFISDAFHHVLRRGYYKEAVAVFRNGSTLCLLSLLCLFVLKEAALFSRIVFFAIWVIYMIMAFVLRIIWKNILRKKKAKESIRSIFIVSSVSVVSQVIRNIRRENTGEYKIAGIALLDVDATGTLIADERVVASKDTVLDYICHNWVDEVFVNVGEDINYTKEFLDEISKTGVTVHVNLAKLVKENGKKQFIETIGGYTVLTTSVNYMTQRQAFLKRSLDIVGGFVGCVCTAVLFVILAPMIYLASPGPIFFSQIRVGQNGKRFKIYKFRSMYMDAEERKKELLEQNRIKDGLMFKMDFDPRIIGNKILSNGEKKTGIGQFIRRTSLDEFPQFYNVLKGDMSLVGTRPPTVDEWENYEHHHHVRLATKPGITGMWQVSGRSEITDFEQVVNLDKKYINEWNMGMDFRILFKTVGIVLKGEGSL